jgi:hypothetical protein
MFAYRVVSDNLGLLTCPFASTVEADVYRNDAGEPFRFRPDAIVKGLIPPLQA